MWIVPTIKSKFLAFSYFFYMAPRLFQKVKSLTFQKLYGGICHLKWYRWPNFMDLAHGLIILTTHAIPYLKQDNKLYEERVKWCWCFLCFFLESMYCLWMWWCGDTKYCEAMLFTMAKITQIRLLMNIALQFVGLSRVLSFKSIRIRSIWAGQTNQLMFTTPEPQFVKCSLSCCNGTYFLEGLNAAGLWIEM